MTARIQSESPRADKETRKVLSSGGVIVDERGRVLLLRRADEGIWCFPKGHVEPGETPQAAAAREIREECGLLCMIGRKVSEIRYAYYWRPDDVNYDKRVVYFLARPESSDIRLEDRFDAWRWVSPSRALRMLFHRNDKDVLRKAAKAAGLTATRKT
ncbi:MAG: NUDIX domain-containing protein [Euryarchaeota archaeon]|nr:NUDIX domain-containing protein [Euryarchaeota archaeon]